MSLINAVYPIASIGEPLLSLEQLQLDTSELDEKINLEQLQLASLHTVYDQLCELSNTVVADTNVNAASDAVNTILLPTGVSTEGWTEAKAFMGGVYGYAKLVWGVIWAASKKIWKLLGIWYVKIFSTATTLVFNANKLRDKASAKSGTPKLKSIKLGGGFKTLAVNRQSKSIDLKPVTDLVKGSVSDSVKIANEAGKQYLDMLKTLSASKTGTILYDKKPFGFAKLDLDKINLQDPGKDTVSKGQNSGVAFDPLYNIKYGEALPGNKTLYEVEVLEPSTKAVPYFTELAKCKKHLAATDTKLSIGSGTFDALSSEGIVKLAESILEVVHPVLELKKHIKSSNDNRLKFAEAVNDFVLKDSKKLNVSKSGTAEIKAIIDVSKTLISWYDYPRKDIIAYAISVCSTAILYGNNCLNNLE